MLPDPMKVIFMSKSKFLIFRLFLYVLGASLLLCFINAGEKEYRETMISLSKYNYSENQFTYKYAQEGDVNAKYYLGLMYALGMGVSKDREKAKFLFRCMAQDSCTPGKLEYYAALYIMFQCSYKNVPCQRDPSEVDYWMNESAKQNYYEAKIWIEDLMTSKIIHCR